MASTEKEEPTSDEAEETSRRLRIRPSRLAQLSLFFIIVLTTGFRFNNGPIYDDIHVIVETGVIHRPKLALQVFNEPTMFISTRPTDTVSHVDTYRPLPVLSFFLNAAMSGKKLWSYHLTNLLLHAACTLLLFALIRRWLGGGKIKAAFFGAALFAVNPWLAEAHVWINGRSDPMALAFGLGTALVLLRRKTTPQRLALAGLLFLCGLLCKESLLPTLPAFLLLDSKRTLGWRERIVRVVPLVLATGIYLAMRLRVLGGMKTHENESALKEAMFRGPALVFDAVWHLLVPSFPFLRSLRDDFNSVPRFVLGASFVALALAAFVVFRLRTKWTTGPFASLFFLGSVAPVTGISVILWAGYGRYLYLPAAALALAVAELVTLLRPRLRGPWRRAAIAVGGLYLLVQAALLISFTTDMDRDETLYLAATDRRPNQAYGWGFLGSAYSYTDQDELAIGALRKAVALDPSEQRFTARLATVLARRHRCEEAKPVAEAANQRFHGVSGATFHFVLAMCADSPERAAFHLRRCLIQRPGKSECEEALRFLVTKHEAAASARSALRRMAETIPAPAFDEKWGPLLREP